MSERTALGSKRARIVFILRRYMRDHVFEPKNLSRFDEDCIERRRYIIDVTLVEFLIDKIYESEKDPIDVIRHLYFVLDDALGKFAMKDECRNYVVTRRFTNNCALAEERLGDILRFIKTYKEV